MNHSETKYRKWSQVFDSKRLTNVVCVLVASFVILSACANTAQENAAVEEFLSGTTEEFENEVWDKVSHCLEPGKGPAHILTRSEECRTVLLNVDSYEPRNAADADVVLLIKSIGCGLDIYSNSEHVEDRIEEWESPFPIGDDGWLTSLRPVKQFPALRDYFRCVGYDIIESSLQVQNTDCHLIMMNKETFVDSYSVALLVDAHWPKLLVNAYVSGLEQSIDLYDFDTDKFVEYGLDVAWLYDLIDRIQAAEVECGTVDMLATG